VRGRREEARGVAVAAHALRVAAAAGGRAARPVRIHRSAHGRGDPAGPAAAQPPAIRQIAAGGDVAATRWGDLVAVASDSGVALYDPVGRRDATFVPLTDKPRALAFSPSGH